MKRGFLGLLLFFSLHAQEYEERIVGAVLNKIDHETMQFFRKLKIFKDKK